MEVTRTAAIAIDIMVATRVVLLLPISPLDILIIKNSYIVNPFIVGSTFVEPKTAVMMAVGLSVKKNLVKDLIMLVVN